MKRVLLTIALLVAPAIAQNYGGSQTLQVKVFDAVTSTGASSTLRNLGQSAHWLTYCPDANVTGLSIAIQASFDGVTWFNISAVGSTLRAVATCSVLQGGGYFPNIRANLASISGAGAHVTAWYTSANSPIPGSPGVSTALPSLLYGTADRISIGSNAPLPFSLLGVDGFGGVGTTYSLAVTPLPAAGSVGNIANYIPRSRTVSVAGTPARVGGVGYLWGNGILGVTVYNPNASVCYLDVYDSVASPTIGGAAYTFSIPVAATSTTTLPLNTYSLVGPGQGLANEDLWLTGATAPGGNTGCASSLVATVFYL